MGCGGSKTVAVREQTNLEKNNLDKDGNNNASVNEVNPLEINVFPDTQIEVNESANLCDNAKPRLIHSAIRRNNQTAIKPVINEPIESESDDRVEDNLASRNSNITVELSRISDSGLGCTSVVSDNTERDKGSAANTAYKHRSKTPNFGITTPDSVNRPDSGRTGSILTTSALNASFLTTGEDDPNVTADVTLDLHTPFSEFTDADENTFRTLSITPSVRSTSLSVEATPVLHTKHIGVIKEESEGGFTPRSSDFVEDMKIPANVNNGILPKFLPRMVLSHNKQAGMKEWVVYKRKVYDVNLIIATFSEVVEAYLECKIRLKKKLDEERKQEREERNVQRARNTKSDESDSSDDWDWSDNEEYPEEYEANEQCISYGEMFEQRDTWNIVGMETLLRLHLDSDVINQHLPGCCKGEIVQPNTPLYWDDVRKDIRNVMDDLNRADARDELNPYTFELKEQLKNWLNEYRDQTPKAPEIPVGDPNEHSFLLPTRFQYNPELLRNWVEEWVEFDLAIPDTGAWPRYEVEKIDLGDPHEIFKATLRPTDEHYKTFDLSIDDDGAWILFPENIVAEDIVTPEQEAIEESRRHRKDLDDPKRMKKRRNSLLQYFTSKYKLQPSLVEHFSGWAQAMEEGDRKFKELCGQT